jgi:hypothetical protein
MAEYLVMPKELITERFGHMERASMDKEALTTKYYDRLAQGVIPPDRFMPPMVSAEEVPGLIAEGRALLKRLMSAMEGWGEAELDVFMCPHPAMGPLTAREMVMFTVLHADHHTRSISRITA